MMLRVVSAFRRTVGRVVVVLVCGALLESVANAQGKCDRACLEGADFRPDCCGIIVADEYDAEILRPAPSHPLAAARRKVEIERLARTALRRQLVGLDPHCSAWGQGHG